MKRNNYCYDTILSESRAFSYNAKRIFITKISSWTCSRHNKRVAEEVKVNLSLNYGYLFITWLTLYSNLLSLQYMWKVFDPSKNNTHCKLAIDRCKLQSLKTMFVILAMLRHLIIVLFVHCSGVVGRVPDFQIRLRDGYEIHFYPGTRFVSCVLSCVVSGGDPDIVLTTHSRTSALVYYIYCSGPQSFTSPIGTSHKMHFMLSFT